MALPSLKPHAARPTPARRTTKGGPARRTTVVLRDEDEAALRRIKREAGIVSTTRALRFSLRAALRTLDEDCIRRSYLEQPESPTERDEAAGAARAALRGLEKERW